MYPKTLMVLGPNKPTNVWAPYMTSSPYLLFTTFDYFS